MIDYPTTFIDGIDIIVIAERVIVVAVLVLVMPFLIVAISQLRLLNRFFKTPAAPVWMIITISLLLITLGAGAWYFVSIYG